ncbi:MAG TPA: ATP-dependent sacrificial sulfur transferase LarE [Thermoanaerobaculia bacterium]|nr:ATP-dependent sacrificial sulfur transferase LarE [Thermoanaerobaculia bacterium]
MSTIVDPIHASSRGIAAVDAAEALARLEAAIRPRGRLLVAFSGGVDSGVLLAGARRVLGEGAIAITADSPSMPRRELEEAIRFAAALGAEHRVVRTDEISLPQYARNDRDRCFWCKHTLFEICERIAAEEGLSIAYGYTCDDAGDHRPGHEAARRFGVVAPLADAGLGKSQIRAIARALDLELWDKPAAPCLSSRIPYGSEVTVDKLGMIEGMEALLRKLGFRICRARFDGTTMRIELEPADIARAADPAVREALLAGAARLGVPLLTLDLEGFRSGKLNRSDLQ